MVQMSAILPDFAGFVISRGDFHLRLTEPLGNGAYGVVYVAEDISPQPKGARFYAVKCLLRHPEGSDYARLQQRELTNHAIVSDIPNVVTLHMVMEEEFYTFIVLDLCTGGDLFTAIMTTDTFVHNTAAVKRSFLQILDAVEACHAKGVYHRDLKPENILCSHDFKRVFLGDFGLSTRSKRSSNFGCGSSFYMSPECIGVFHEKKPYATAPSDVWALGTILCNLITGRNPWHVASPNEDAGFRIYLRRGPAWLIRHLPISLEAAAILSRIFELDPETRITIPELREAIFALQTFYPDTEAASSSATTGLKTQAHSVATHAAPARARRTSLHEVDITDGWALEPIAPTSPLATNFLDLSSDALTAAATATLAGTISTFVNDDASSDISDGSEPDDAWSMSGPPGFGSSTDVSSDNTDESGGESDLPVTPETYATDFASSVPGLALDASPRPSGECDIASASSRLAELRADAGKKRRLSVSRLIEGVRRIKLRA